MWLALGLFGISIVFNAGGFFWLAKNHIHHVNEDLKGLKAEMSEVKEDVAFIKGQLE